MKSYSDRTVYVTGGTSGIGLAAARLFSAAGANVVVFSRDPRKLEATLPALRAAQVSERQRFRAERLDVGDRAAVEQAFAEAARSPGPPDVLINSAGVAWCNHFEATPYEKYEEEMRTNFFGVLHAVRSALPLMKPKGGHIVNVSSVVGFVGVFGYAAYAPAKFAVIGFSEVIRAEFRKYAIGVSVLCPPDTDTPQLAEENRTKPAETRAISGNAGLMQPEQVARAMVKGMEAGRFMIVPGFQGRTVYWAKRFLPGLVFASMDADARKAQRPGQGKAGVG